MKPLTNMTLDLARMRAESRCIRYELAARKFINALEMEALLRAKFNANQPRVPPGNPTGGQWTSGGGGGGGAASGAGLDFGGGAEPGFNPDTNENFEDDSGSNAADVTQVAEAGADERNLYSTEKPGWHDYTTGPKEVCAADLKCTQEEMQDFISRFAVPGQDPEKPVKDDSINPVYDPRTGIYAGKVKTLIAEDKLSATNITEPGHTFYKGEIARWVYQDENGAWFVITRGVGNNAGFGDRYTADFYARINGWQGPKIFSFMDDAMREFIERQKRGRKFAPGKPDAPRVLFEYGPVVAGLHA